MAQTHLPPNWQTRLLVVLGGSDAYNEGVRLFDAWATAEGGTAKWNPLNTTWYLPGSWPYNSANVRNYQRPTQGIAATCLTIVNGYYNGILGALQGGTASATQIVEQHAHEFDTWGTGAANILRVLNT